jgi:hypothetical protein
MGKKQDKIKAITGDAGEMMGRDSGLQIRDVDVLIQNGSTAGNFRGGSA